MCVLNLKRIKPLFGILIPEIEVNIVFRPSASGASSILNFPYNVIANFDRASGRCLCRGRLYNDWVLLHGSSSQSLSIFVSKSPLKSLVYIILSETMLYISEKMKACLPSSKISSHASHCFPESSRC